MEIYTLTLLGVFVVIFMASQGGHDQMLVANLSAKLGAGPGLVLASAIATCISTGAWCWLGLLASAELGDPYLPYVITFAIILAAVLLVLPVRLTPIKEPTRSVGAITIVLTMRQLFDAARLLTFAAFAYATASAFLAAAAFSGSMLALALGMAKGTTLQHWPYWVLLRLALAIMLLVGAMFIAFKG